MSNWKITLVSPEGDEVVVHPEHQATHGIYLAEDQVKGDIIDAPIKTEWDSLAMQEGGTQRSIHAEYRDIALGFHVTDNKTSAEEADDILRQLFSYEEDEWDPDENRQTRMDFEVVGGPFAGSIRSLDLLMHDTPDIEFARDMFMDQYINPQVYIRAGQPMWYEPTVVKPENVFSWTDATPRDAQGNVNGFVWVENPTDRAMRHGWTVAGNAGTQATLPDMSWVGKKGARVIGGPDPNRTIKVSEITSAGGGIKVTLERGKVMVQDKNGTNAMGRMPEQGKVFLYRIPPYTKKTALPVKVKPVAGGGRVEVRLPMRWSRPYGLYRW